MKKLLLILCLGMFLISLTSAELLQFDNIKQYNPNTQTITIVNTFGLGEDIAKIKLNTPSMFYVSRGYQKVAEFELTNYKDYSLSNALEEIKFYDYYNRETEYQKQFDYKIKAYQDIIINDYETQTKYMKNGTPYYENVIIGSHTEQKEIWLPLEISNLEKDLILTIGVFTEVNKGDIVEWIPKYYGKKIDEWAGYTESIKTDLQFHYDLDELSGAVVVDRTNQLNATNTEVTIGVVGKLGSAYDFGGYSEADSLNITTVSYAQQTFSVWLDVENVVVGNQNIIFGKDDGASNREFAYDINWLSGEAKMTLQWGTTFCQCSGASVNDTGFHHIVYVWDDDTNVLVCYMDGVNFGNCSNAGSTDLDSSLALIGRRNIDGAKSQYDGVLDHIDWWSRTLTDTEVAELYNSGNGLNFSIPDDYPKVTALLPVDWYNSSSSVVNFIANVTDDLLITNVSLLINGSIEQTNSSGIQGNYTFSKALSNGVHNWNIVVFDNATHSNETANRTINISVIPPTINLYLPENNNITNNPYVTFIGDVTDNFEIENVSLYIDTILNETNTTGVKDVNYTFSKYLSEATHTWYYEAYDNDSNPTTTLSRNIIIDYSNPIIDVVLPQNTTYYTSNYTSTNLSIIWLNWTSYDVNPSLCWYDFLNGTKKFLTCNTNESIGLNFSSYNIRFYSNDSVNQTSNILRTPTYEYLFFENSYNYNSNTTETFEENFILNLTLGNGVTLNSAYFNYNGTAYLPSLSINGNRRILSKSISIPDVSETQNATFFWTLNSNIYNINTTSINQTIYPLIIDNCTANIIHILNYTIYDEETRETLNVSTWNTTSYITIKLSGDVTGAEYEIYNFTTTQNPISICVNTSLGTKNYRLDTEVKYNADDYVTEYHYLNNHTLNTSVIPKNISLYLLKTLDSQEFLITYKDKYLNPIENMFIEIWRQYLDIGKYLLVEVSRTDNDGRTIGHFVLSDEIYNVYAYEGETKEIKASYQNVRAYCEDVTTGNCKINLEEQVNYESPTSYTNYLGVIGLETYDTTTKTYTFTFSTTNSTALKVNMSIFKYDVYLNTSICSEETTATSGTFTCVIPSVYYNNSVLALIYVNDQLYSSNLFYVSSFQERGLIPGGFILAFLLVITIPLLAITSGPMTLVLFIVGLVLAGGLFFISFGGFIGGFSAFLWLVISAIILIIKSSKKREQV